MTMLKVRPNFHPGPPPHIMQPYLVRDLTAAPDCCDRQECVNTATGKRRGLGFLARLCPTHLREWDRRG